MKERIIIVFVAIAIGLIVTTATFFIYQSTRKITKDTTNTKNQNKTGTEDKKRGELFLTVDEPNDEAVFTTRTIQVKGRTNSENTLIVSSNQEDTVATPTNDGTYAITLNIDVGTNKIIIKAVAPNGSSVEDSRIVSFSTEEF